MDAIFTPDNLGTVYNTKVFRAIDGLGTTNLPGELENTYSGELNVHALYADAIYKVGEKWTLVPGVRVEAF